MRIEKKLATSEIGTMVLVALLKARVRSGSKAGLPRQCQSFRFPRVRTYSHGRAAAHHRAPYEAGKAIRCAPPHSHTFWADARVGRPQIHRLRPSARARGVI